MELKKAGLQALPQNPITVYYDNEVVGEFVADVVVEDEIILELFILLSCLISCMKEVKS